MLLTGDFVIWAAPNAGNPQKAQRYAREWAEALRAMAKTGAEVLLPGHGIPVFGSIRVRQVLNDTAEYLQSLYDQTLKMMNEGAPLDDIVHDVKPPARSPKSPTCNQCTMSRSSSCATCGGSKADGTMASPRI